MKNATRKGQLNLWIDEEHIKNIRIHAAKRNLTLSAWVRAVINEALANETKYDK